MTRITRHLHLKEAPKLLKETTQKSNLSKSNAISHNCEASQRGSCDTYLLSDSSLGSPSQKLWDFYWRFIKPDMISFEEL